MFIFFIEDGFGTAGNIVAYPDPSKSFGLGHVCANQITYVEIGSTVIIKSPGYPKTYPASLNCTWTISTVRQDERVRLAFSSLNVDARGDHLSLYDGKSTDPDLKMTGPLDMIFLETGKFLQPAGIKRPYFSSGKFLTLEMLSNEDGHQTSGFQLSATSVKKGMWNIFNVFTYLKGYLPLNSHSDSHCLNFGAIF